MLDGEASAPSVAAIETEHVVLCSWIVMLAITVLLSGEDNFLCVRACFVLYLDVTLASVKES